MVRFVLFCDFFTSGFDEFTGFTVIQFIINVDNSSFFHGNASKGDVSATDPPFIIPLEEFILLLKELICDHWRSVNRFYPAKQ